MTPKQKLKRIIIQQERKTLAYEKKYAKVVKRALIEQVNYASTHNGTINFEPMRKAVLSLFEDVALYFGVWQYDILDKKLVTKADGFFLNNLKIWMQIYMNTYLASHVTEINDTTQKQIQRILSKGIGQDFQTLADLLQTNIDSIASNFRAVMIARTEIANAVNAAKKRSSDDWEDETKEQLYKLWIHRFAKEPRSWHKALDNDIAIPKEQDFRVIDPKGNEELMSRPHAEGATAKNTVNCSCQVMYVSERFAKSLLK